MGEGTKILGIIIIAAIIFFGKGGKGGSGGSGGGGAA